MYCFEITDFPAFLCPDSFILLRFAFGSLILSVDVRSHNDVEHEDIVWNLP